MPTFEKHKFTAEWRMVVDLNERGWFKAHVENTRGRTVFECSNEDDTGWPSEDGFWLVEDGWMRHALDVEGMRDYLVHRGIATERTRLRLEP